MATTLAIQSFGVRGAAVAFVAADATGNTAPNGRGMLLLVRNTTAGALRVRLEAARACSHGRTSHYLEESIPAHPTPAEAPFWAIAIGENRDRFGDGVRITYPDGAAGLEVAVARIGELAGVGSDAEVPPALGPAPGTVPIFDKDTEVVLELAAPDGMVLRGNNGRLEPRIENNGGATRTVYFHAARRCSFGFYDDEVVTLEPGTRLEPRLLPVARFGRDVSITYDDADGLYLAAVRMESFTG